MGTYNRCVQVKSAGQSAGTKIHRLNKKCRSECRYSDTNIYFSRYKDAQIQRYEQITVQHSAGQSMGTKIQIYVCRYKDAKYEDMCKICTADMCR